MPNKRPQKLNEREGEFRLSNWPRLKREQDLRLKRLKERRSPKWKGLKQKGQLKKRHLPSNHSIRANSVANTNPPWHPNVEIVART